MPITEEIEELKRKIGLLGEYITIYIRSTLWCMVDQRIYKQDLI